MVTGISPGLSFRLDRRRPVADWLCRCGHHERATGKAAVIRLTARATVGTCPHTTDTNTLAAERSRAA
jgi:hypothetical protein